MGQKIKHPFFGELDSDYIADLRCWDFSFSFQGQKIDVALWEFKGGKGINKKTLDFFADFLKDFANRDRIARNTLEEYLSEDDDYIIYHIEEMDLDVSDNVDDFVEKMVVNHIACWGDGKIIIDYMISPEESDEILAVKFDQAGNVEIAWES